MTSNSKHDPDNLGRSLSETILDLFDHGEASVAEKEGKRITKLRVTKIGQKAEKNVTIHEVNELLKSNNFMEEELSTTKRIYRRKGDLPNPKADPHHSSNRLTKPMGTRISPEHIELFNSLATNFPNKRKALEHAIELLAKTEPPEPG